MRSHLFILLTMLFTLSNTSQSPFFAQPDDNFSPATVAYTHLMEENNSIDKVLFAPQQALMIETILIGLIQSTQTSITGALFRLSNKKIIDALIEAHKRNVKIDIILDPDALSTSKEISRLSQAGIPLSLYNGRKYGSYMHHKFLIFYNTLACEKNDFTPLPALVSFGSLNLTQNGFNGNRENINFRTKPEVIQAFENELEELKKGTDSYQLISPGYKSKKNTSSKVGIFTRLANGVTTLKKIK